MYLWVHTPQPVLVTATATPTERDGVYEIEYRVGDRLLTSHRGRETEPADLNDLGLLAGHRTLGLAVRSPSADTGVLALVMPASIVADADRPASRSLPEPHPGDLHTGEPRFSYPIGTILLPEWRDDESHLARVSRALAMAVYGDERPSAEQAALALLHKSSMGSLRDIDFNP